MRKILLITSLLFFVLLAPRVLAQDSEDAEETSNTTDTSDTTNAVDTIDDSENLDIVLSYANQSPNSKEFDLIAEISSGIDSDRVVVEWQLPSGLKFADSATTKYSRPSVTAGETTIVTKRVIARYARTSEVEVIATAVKADVNYVSSDKLELSFNEAKEVVPLSEEYKDAKTMYQITQVLLYIGLAALLFGLAYFAYRWVRSIRS
ncbi:hypothetical protein GF389_04740 [Candidatus Dojkabacteria bacterium]|nr:hypothetical protein [Candidatus Dojkabacteria bacterium]